MNENKEKNNRTLKINKSEMSPRDSIGIMKLFKIFLGECQNPCGFKGRKNISWRVTIIKIKSDVSP